MTSKIFSDEITHLMKETLSKNINSFRDNKEYKEFIKTNLNNIIDKEFDKIDKKLIDIKNKIEDNNEVVKLK